jgi:hypothetical protein
MILEETPLAKSATVMRREVWEQGERDFPVLDGSIADLTMWIRAALFGWAFWYVEEPLVAVSMHPGQMSVQDEMPDRYLRAYERFRFDDPICERLRRARVADAHLGRARVHLHRRRVRAARREIAAARAVAPSSLGLYGWSRIAGIRPLVLRFVLQRPVLAAVIVPAWNRWRPTIARMAGILGGDAVTPRQR